MEQIGTIDYTSQKSRIFIACNALIFLIPGLIAVFSCAMTEKSNIGLVGILLYAIIYTVLHEAVHALFIWIFSGRKIRISFSFPIISIGSDTLFSRKQFIVIALSPSVIFGFVLVLLLLVSGDEYNLLFTVLLILDTAGSGGDFFQVLSAMKFPASALFRDDSAQTAVLSVS